MIDILMMKTVIHIAILLACMINSPLAFSQKELRKYDLKPVAKGISNALYIQNSQRAFFVLETGESFTVGIADMVNAGKFYELKFKHISDYHAVKTYTYSKTGDEDDKDLYVYIIDIDGDSLPIDSLALGKENDYQLISRKGINANKEYNRFPLSAKNKLTHLALPGLYDIFGHDVIFHIPEEGMNTINIYLNIPNEFYIFTPSKYASITAEEGTVLKMIYTDEKISEYKNKSGENDPVYLRDLESEKKSWEPDLKKKPLKTKK
jgi:hypothetical protein